jgi:hypothetical protein
MSAAVNRAPKAEPAPLDHFDPEAKPIKLIPPDSVSPRKPKAGALPLELQA